MSMYFPHDLAPLVLASLALAGAWLVSFQLFLAAFEGAARAWTRKNTSEASRG